MKKQNQFGNTFPHLVAWHQDAQSAQAYIALLTNLLQRDEIPAEEVLSLLALEGKEGWTFANCLTRSKDAQSIQAYIMLLTDLLQRKEIPAAQVFSLLALQVQDDLTFGHEVAWKTGCPKHSSLYSIAYRLAGEWATTGGRRVVFACKKKINMTIHSLTPSPGIRMPKGLKPI